MGGGFFINKTQSYTESTGTGVLTAPVDTAENDLMLGMLLHSTDYMTYERNLDGWEEPFPTGWTQIYWYRYLTDPPYSNDGRRLSLFFKMATSSDTAGTTYSFTRGTGWQSGKVWAATLTFRGIGAYGGSLNHNLTNYARRWSTTRTMLFDSANNVLAPRQSDNRLVAVHIIGRYGLAAANPTEAQSGNTWVQHLVVREGTLSSSYAVTISSTTGNSTTGVLQLPTIPMQRFTNGAYPYGYTSEYDSVLLELVTTENALLLDPLPASSTKKKPLTEEQKLARAAGRSRLFEYSKPQRSNLWLSTGNKYNKAKGYI